MTSILRQAISETRQEWRAAVRCFWYVALAFVGLPTAFVAFGIYYQTDDEFYVGLRLAEVLVIFLIGLVLASHGAVAWHQKLLLSREPGWVPPRISRRTLRYALLVFGLTLLYILGGSILESTWKVLIQYFSYDGRQGEVAWAAFLSNFYFGRFSPLQFTSMIGRLVFAALFLVLVGNIQLLLPRIAVDSQTRVTLGRREKRGFYTAMFSVWSIPIICERLIGMLYSYESMVFVVITIAVAALCWLLSISVLSVTYRPAVSAGIAT